MTDPSERIDELAERASRDRAAFDRPAEPPDEEAALEYLIDGVGEVVGLYIEARTGGESGFVRFDEAEFDRLERALNGWLELYAACYGAELDATFTVREAAELLFETHSIRETAALLTRVPERDDERAWGFDRSGAG